MATRRLGGIATSSSVPDNGGDNSGGGGSGGGYVDDVFSTYVYEGTGADLEIENGVDLDGKGGLTWIKCRTFGLNNLLFDTERGVGKALLSDTNSAQGTEDLQQLNSFNDNGFSLGDNANVNVQDKDFVSWTFRKAPSFFDVVTYTGDGTSDFSYKVPHNLGCQPGLVIFKNVSASSDWLVWTERCWGSGTNLFLNSSVGEGGPNELNGRGYVENGGNYDLTPSVTGTGVNANKLGDEYVAYVFAHDDSDESMIKCGSFTVSSTSGIQEIDLGWEPQFLLVKRADSPNTGYNWDMYDTMRGWVDVVGQGNVNRRLSPNLGEKEVSDSTYQPCSTGFRFESGWGPQEFIYMAIRRPNKPAEEFEPEELFAVDAGVTDVAPAFRTPFVADMGISTKAGESWDNFLASRLASGTVLKPNENEAETVSSAYTWDYMDGWCKFLMDGVTHWSWRRAPGFFDVVCYEGTGSTETHKHNLGVTPELMIYKSRTNAKDWIVHTPSIIAAKGFLKLNENWEVTLNSNQGYTDTLAPTDTTFTVGSYQDSMAGWAYIAYLFASVPGICDIGSFTDTGSDMDIDCGFTNGARFVLIKPTNNTGDWSVFDTYRGISDANSPRLALNDTGGQQGGTSIKPFSGGFKASLSTAGWEYIYYAIA